jgi:acyl carrier protein
MNRDNALAHVQTALAEVLNRQPEGLAEQDRLLTDLGLDSTTIIELLLVLEDGVGLDIDPDDLNASVFESVGSLTDYVANKVAAAG